MADQRSDTVDKFWLNEYCPEAIAVEAGAILRRKLLQKILATNPKSYQSRSHRTAPTVSMRLTSADRRCC